MRPRNQVILHSLFQRNVNSPSTHRSTFTKSTFSFCPATLCKFSVRVDEFVIPARNSKQPELCEVFASPKYCPLYPCFSQQYPKKLKSSFINRLIFFHRDPSNT